MRHRSVAQRAGPSELPLFFFAQARRLFFSLNTHKIMLQRHVINQLIINENKNILVKTWTNNINCVSFNYAILFTQEVTYESLAIRH